MRLLHTSDWHLGRLFHRVHLTEDQAHVLEQLVQLARELEPDVVVVTGDVYDRAVPPPEAVALLDETLSRLTLDLELRVVLTAGNHDSPERLGFGRRLLASAGAHLVGRLDPGLAPLELADQHGPVALFALPYAEPAVVRERLGDEQVHDHQGAMAALVQRMAARRPSGARTVLLAHAFVAGGEPSESERPLSVGGAGTVDAATLAGFDYVALGHLHRPQSVVDGRIEYAGSLLKYSFSEATHAKSVSLVEMDAAGRCRVERWPLVPRHDVRRVSGQLAELLRGPASGERADDYLEASLLDDGPVLDPMGRLLAVYPNLLLVSRPAIEARADALASTGASADHRRRDELDAFRSFFEDVTSRTLEPEQAAAFARLIERMHAREREGAP
jgi:DNA repair protein SbcD/Mre11